MSLTIVAIITVLLAACSATDTTPHTQPNVTITTWDDPVDVGQAARFIATVDSHGQDASITWTFGDGMRTEHAQASVTHAFDSPGEFSVSVTASVGSLSASDTVSVTVRAQTGTPEPDHTPDPEPGPEPDPIHDQPFSGEAHLGTWLWAAITDSHEFAGTVSFDEFLGNEPPDMREIIAGTWTDCSYGMRCMVMGDALMLESRVGTAEWAPAFSLFIDLDILALGIEMQLTDNELPRTYIASGEFYGEEAVFVLTHWLPAPAAVDTLAVAPQDFEALFNLIRD